MKKEDLDRIRLYFYDYNKIEILYRYGTIFVICGENMCAIYIMKIFKLNFSHEIINKNGEKTIYLQYLSRRQCLTAIHKYLLKKNEK